MTCPSALPLREPGTSWPRSQLQGPPYASTSHGFASKRGHRATANCSPAMPSVSVSFFYEAISKLQTTNILLEGHVVPGVYVPGASSCNPLVSPQLQSRALQMPRAAFLPSKPPCMQRFRTKLPQQDQSGSQIIAVPGLGLETPFSCFGDWGVSINVSKGRSLLCSQALRWEVERSVPWSGCDISQLAVLLCGW